MTRGSSRWDVVRWALLPALCCTCACSGEVRGHVAQVDTTDDSGAVGASDEAAAGGGPDGSIVSGADSGREREATTGDGGRDGTANGVDASSPRDSSTDGDAPGDASVDGDTPRDAAADGDGADAGGRLPDSGCGDGACRGAIDLTLGDEHACLVLRDGTVWCWGSTALGRLGSGPPDGAAMSLVPVRVEGLSGVSQASAGAAHTCALSAGSVWCWGTNAGGVLGDGTSAPSSATPIAVALPDSARQIVAGHKHNCTLQADRTVWCWGSDSQGQLGDPQQGSRAAPAAVPGLSGVLRLAAAGNVTCALLSSEVKCWGNATPWFAGSTTPASLPDLGGVRDLALGDQHACVRFGDDGVGCFGANALGQLGDGTTTPHATAERIDGLTSVTSLSTGFNVSGGHTCAVAGGVVRCWGDDAVFQSSGVVNFSTTTRPSPVAPPGLVGPVAVRTGRRASCAIEASGAVKCWGCYQGGGLLCDGNPVTTIDW